MTLEEGFRILELPKTATFKEVRSAYRRLARIHHPDRHHQSGRAIHEAEESMKLLNAAFAAVAAALDPSRHPTSRPGTAAEHHASRAGRQTALSRFRALWRRGVRLDLGKDNLADYAFGAFILTLLVCAIVAAAQFARESRIWIPVLLFDLIAGIVYVIHGVWSFFPDPEDDP